MTLCSVIGAWLEISSYHLKLCTLLYQYENKHWECGIILAADNFSFISRKGGR